MRTLLYIKAGLLLVWYDDGVGVISALRYLV